MEESVANLWEKNKYFSYHTLTHIGIFVTLLNGAEIEQHDTNSSQVMIK